ncbi:two-component system sensor histidine kinase NtrB [Thermosulfuriphilus sp.]
MVHSLSFQLSPRTMSRHLQNLQDLLDILPELAILVDSNFEIRWVNQRLCAWGLDEKDLVGRPLASFFSERAFSNLKERLSSSGRLKDFEASFSLPSGLSRPVVINGLCLPEGRILIISSPSCQELDCQQLARLERLATVGLLAAAVAHDLNTPLGIILGYVQMLKEDLSHDDRLLKVLSIIERQIDHCRGLTHRLLRLGCSQEEGFKEVDLNQIIQETVELLAESFRSRKIKPVMNLAKNLHKIWGEPGRLREVFINLLTNALEAIDDSGEIFLRTENQGPWVVVGVADTGRGIPEEKKPYLFRPFFSCKEKGTGLGLFVVDSILRQHGATIELQSPIEDPRWGLPGRGTVFILRFPRSKTQREP